MNDSIEETCDQAYLTDSIDDFDECNFDKHSLPSYDDITDESFFVMRMRN